MEVKEIQLTAEEEVLDCVLNSLREGRIPWRKTWKDGAAYARNYHSGHVFKGINELIAGCSRFDTPYFLTKRQIVELGVRLAKNAEALPMIFWQKEGQNLNLKLYKVYNVEELRGIKLKLALAPKRKVKLAAAEQMLADIPNRPTIDTSLRDTSCYNVLLDTIFMPSIGRITSAEGYYQLLFPRLIQASGHARRLARKGVEGEIRFGKYKFTSEDLIADFGSSLLYRKFGFDFPAREDQEAYIKGWIQELKGKSHRLFLAAAAARKAVDYLVRND